jgi:hypothetical protein
VVEARCFCKTAGAGVEADRRALIFHGSYGVDREVSDVVRLCQVGQRQTVLEWCFVFGVSQEGGQAADVGKCRKEEKRPKSHSKE